MKSCELCDAEATTFVGKQIMGDNNWRFLCDKHADEFLNFYYVPLNRYYSEQEGALDWEDHLSGKTWFDLSNFLAMKLRYES